MSEERLEALEDRLVHLEEKMDLIMEQVQLGKHLWMFAKAIGWLVSAAVGLWEIYRGLKS